MLTSLRLGCHELYRDEHIFLMSKRTGLRASAALGLSARTEYWH